MYSAPRNRRRRPTRTPVRRSCRNTGHTDRAGPPPSRCEGHHVAVLLREARSSAPPTRFRAAGPAAIDSQLAIGRKMFRVTFDRYDVNGLRLVRVHFDREPEISRQTSAHFGPRVAGIVVRMTSQCFCMKSTLGRDGCIAMRCTQCPTSAADSGFPRTAVPDRSAATFDRRPPCEMRPPPRWRRRCDPDCPDPTTIVCRPSPPAPGCQRTRFSFRTAGRSSELLPPSSLWKAAASSTPA